MPAKTLAKVGLIAVALALLLPWSYGYWLETRRFVPVDKPVSLEAGKIQTEQFQINLREDYNVQIDVDYSADDWTREDCAFRWWKDFDWTVYRLSGGTTKSREPWASSAEMLEGGWIPIGFRGKPGKYELEWRGPASSACLNARHPRLHVYTSSSDYAQFNAFLQSACIFLAGTGILLLLRGIGGGVFGCFFSEQPPRMFPEMVVQNVIRLQQHRPMPLICDISNFRVAWGGVLFIFFAVSSMMTPLTPRGFLINFREPKVVGVEKSPWTETVSVFVDAQRRFLLNGQHVKAEDLRAKLQEALGRQMVWMVYLEADNDCAFMDVMDAMDAIQGLGARVIWITPKTREEWSRRSAP